MRSTVKRSIFAASLSLLFFIPVAPALPQNNQTNRVGTVVSTEKGGRYVYAEIEINGETIWCAAPAVELSPGDKVVTSAGLPMKDFYSKTLDRTFDMVYFVGALKKEGAEAAQPLSTTLPADHPPIHQALSKQQPVEFNYDTLERPDGGKTVAEIHAEQKNLAGKVVVVRGIAVKVANGIMGKNWVHLRDGTGDRGSDDLTITTKAKVKVGETVTLRGAVATNRDFGFGYKYDVLLEDAVAETK